MFFSWFLFPYAVITLCFFFRKQTVFHMNYGPDISIRCTCQINFSFQRVRGPRIKSVTNIWIGFNTNFAFEKYIVFVSYFWRMQNNKFYTPKKKTNYIRCKTTNSIRCETTNSIRCKTTNSIRYKITIYIRCKTTNSIPRCTGIFIQKASHWRQFCDVE